MELIFSFYPAIGIVKNAVYSPSEEIASPALRARSFPFPWGKWENHARSSSERVLKYQ
ncbi:MAG: hypothetical protein U5O15_03610 [Candidatus Krumholzibacteriota bacterium]|nr:hypothetical protein [Candidatus Krumholzibacteriota bacterium]